MAGGRGCDDEVERFEMVVAEFVRGAGWNVEPFMRMEGDGLRCELYGGDAGEDEEKLFCFLMIVFDFSTARGDSFLNYTEGG